jgi:hypothetical protein
MTPSRTAALPELPERIGLELPLGGQAIHVRRRNLRQ